MFANTDLDIESSRVQRRSSAFCTYLLNLAGSLVHIIALGISLLKVEFSYRDFCDRFMPVRVSISKNSVGEMQGPRKRTHNPKFLMNTTNLSIICWIVSPEISISNGGFGDSLS